MSSGLDGPGAVGPEPPLRLLRRPWVSDPIFFAELKARLGHSTTHAAMQYQHASKDRDAAIAALLSQHALAEAIPIDRKRRRA